MSTLSVFPRFNSWFGRYIANGGIKTSDSEAKARAIRISNLISISAILNTLGFSILFWVFDDPFLAMTAFKVAVVYFAFHLTTIFGFTLLGRTMEIIVGNIVVFYFACMFQGESMLQMMFYSLLISPLLFFSWEERKFYILAFVPVILLIVGEWYHWSLVGPYPLNIDFRYLRILSMVAPLHQIYLGFFYFLKQSTKFEAESKENLAKLEIEHRKQLQVQKMSSLGEMAGGVSHEINNPLMVIIGKTYNLKRDLRKKLPQDDPSFASLEKIDAMVHRISRIIRALRNFSRNSNHDPSEIVDLRSILESTLDLCQERFSSTGITLEIYNPDDVKILCRPTEISQVLLNLLNNAYDASTLKEDSKVSIQVRKLENQVEIIVEDNGKGIDPKIVDKIMQPFFTTKEVGKGTGLGLSISKGLIESHQGSLSYLPDTGSTTFQILLPIAED